MRYFCVTFASSLQESKRGGVRKGDLKASGEKETIFTVQVPFDIVEGMKCRAMVSFFRETKAGSVFERACPCPQLHELSGLCDFFA